MLRVPGVPAAPVESQHELAAEALPERMAADERFELGDEFRVAPEDQLRIDALLEAGEVLLSEPDSSRRANGSSNSASAAPRHSSSARRSIVAASGLGRLPAPRARPHGASRSCAGRGMAVEVEAVAGRVWISRPVAACGVGR